MSDPVKQEHNEASDVRYIPIQIGKALMFKHYAWFRNCYRSCQSSKSHFKLDLSELEEADFAALAMIALLHEHAGRIGGYVSFENPSCYALQFIDMLELYLKHRD